MSHTGEIPQCHILERYHNVTYWGDTTMSHTGEIPQCHILERYHNVTYTVAPLGKSHNSFA